MSESVTSVDINFSNGGAGHTANVNSVLNVKNPDGTESLGFVEGDIGKRNSFSEQKVDDLLKNFVLVEKTSAKGAVSSTVSRKYADKTSLTLNSYVVLVRGKEATPREEINQKAANGNPQLIAMPYFSEVINSPDMEGFPFPQLGPKVEGCAIIIGKIYNYESAADPNGVKISLVYNNRELQEGLSLNDEWVNPAYKYSDGGFPSAGTGPDLSQYDLKFGYTLEEFKTALSAVDLKQEGLPSKLENVLFETSGTLSSVVSSVASYLGLHWYIHPFTGVIHFVSREAARTMTIEDPTDPENADETVISASFTESELSNTIVNAYVGSEEKKDDKTPKDDDRPRAVFFKRYDITKHFDVFFPRDANGNQELDRQELRPNRIQLGTFFSLFNQGCSEEQFYKLCFLSMFMEWGKDANGDEIEKLSYAPQYVERPHAFDLFDYFRIAPKNAPPNFASVFTSASAAGTHRKKSDLPVPERLQQLNRKWDRITDKFKYYQLCSVDANKLKKNAKKVITRVEMKRLKKPEEMFKFYKAYFEVAGGIFISNAYSEYKSRRMAWNNTNNITLLGPYRYDTEIRDVDELSMINNIFKKLGVHFFEKDEFGNFILDGEGKPLERPMRVHDLAQATNEETVPYIIPPKGEPPVNKWHFIAVRQLPQLEKDNGRDVDEFDNFDYLDKQVELFEPESAKNTWYVGGPTKGPEANPDFVQRTKAAIITSINKYDAAMNNTSKRRLKLTYTRSKTEVNKISDDGEVAEDNALSAASDSAQKISDLFDRYDSKSFTIETPSHKITQPVSLVTTNGTTTEIAAMGKGRRIFNEELVEEPFKSSSKTFYGLHVPDFKETTTSLSFSVSSNGIRTTIGESTLNLLKPDQDYIMNEGMQAIRRDVTTAKLNAAQRNYLGL